MKKILLLLILLFITSCSLSNNSKIIELEEKNSIEILKKEIYLESKDTNYINVKYRNDTIDINNSKFEWIDTSKSSFINGTWYDKENKYLIIKLNSTFYHYCWISINIWNSFKKASSFGTYFNTYIKENYDCRNWYVPFYK